MNVLLQDITTDEYADAEALVLELLRSAYPELDTRRGTAVRDLLVKPAAQMAARDSILFADMARRMSIASLAEDPDTTTEEANSVLSFYGTSLAEGRRAYGPVIVRVFHGRRYIIPAGSRFQSASGAVFSTPAETIADPDPGPSERLIRQDGDGYWFLVDVIADEPGPAGSLLEGDALLPESPIYGFIDAGAYSDFTPGTAGETLQAALSRVPGTLSHRAIESRQSIGAVLAARFGVLSVEAQGHGDPAMLRDRHNPMGIAVGGRVDIYPRTFMQPSVITLELEGTRSAAGEYTVVIPPSDAPCFQRVKSVSDAGTGAALSSYRFTDTRVPAVTGSTAHDIDFTSVPEFAFTIYQKAVLSVHDVPSSEATRRFRVELYSAPLLDSIQAYVDSRPVRNLCADYLVRSPLLGFVSVQARMTVERGYALSPRELSGILSEHIASLPFGYALSRSELASVLLGACDGARRVDMTDKSGMKLAMSVFAADCHIHLLEGDRLDIARIENPQALLVAETVVLCPDRASINIELDFA
jgi:hypothetical protein